MGGTVGELCDLLHTLSEDERKLVLGALLVTRTQDEPAPPSGKARQSGRRTPLPAARSAPGIETSIEWI